MATNILHSNLAHEELVDFPAHGEALRYLVPVGRVFFSAIFIMAGFTHFSSQTVAYAASSGVPLASLLVPFSGLMSIVGGISVLLGFKARYGAGLIALFLVPVTLTMHRFWAVSDPMMAQMQQAMFMKNIAMLGGALLLAYFGSGPLSIDARRSPQGR